jgi:hypothetical protein
MQEMRTVKFIAPALLTVILAASASAQYPPRLTNLPEAAQSRILSLLMRNVPGFPQQAKLTSSSGQTRDQFGISVAVSGDTVVVGIGSGYLQPGSSPAGAAYVFVKPVSGWSNMTQTAELSPSNGHADDYFGYSVAIQDNTIVVGAPNAQRGQGRVYVFVKKANRGWTNRTQKAMLTVSTASSIGYQVAISGKAIVTGSALNSGQSYIFLAPAAGWKTTATPNATLVTPETGQSQVCANCVAIQGSTVVIGVAGNYHGEGTVFVFEEPSGGWQGTVNPIASLVASDPTLTASLGVSVAITGNTIAAGAYGLNNYLGAVYVFVEPESGWSDMTETAQLTAPDALELGLNVSISGTLVVAGAPDSTAGAHQFQGAVFLYTKPSGGWKTTSVPSAELVASDGAAGDEFGWDVSASGSTIVAGAPFAAIASNQEQGAAYVFAKSKPSMPPARGALHKPSSGVR